MGKKTVVFDFDGVINSYTHGWQGASTITDPPVAGIKEEIAKIRGKYKVVIMSSRAATPAGRSAIARYLDKHGIIVDNIVDHKIPAHVYIDDKAIPFNGKTSNLMSDIEVFTPWHDSVSVKKYTGTKK